MPLKEREKLFAAIAAIGLFAQRSRFAPKRTNPKGGNVSVTQKKGDIMVTLNEKQELKNQLVACLKRDKDIRKVVIFGSFVTSDEPCDMDVAVFQESREGYLKLSMKYRKLTRPVSNRIPVDIFPIRADAGNASILTEIDNGEVVYER
jgi:predicted nucleotidyltransferase